MMEDNFIEDVLTLQSEKQDMIYREFHGMEAVAKYEKEHADSNEE